MALKGILQYDSQTHLPGCMLFCCWLDKVISEGGWQELADGYCMEYCWRTQGSSVSPGCAHQVVSIYFNTF